MIKYIFFVNYEKCLDKFEVVRVFFFIWLYFTLHVHSNYLGLLNKEKMLPFITFDEGNNDMKTQSMG